MNRNFKLIKIAFFILFSILYLMMNYRYASSIVMVGDTRQYYYSFYDINSNPFPFGIEIVIPLLMKICFLFGLDFSKFIFICGSTWLMVIYFIFKLSNYNNKLLLLLFFFLSHLFFDNVSFVLRQYLSCCFFIASYYYYSQRGRVNIFLSVTFFLLSFFTHTSAIIYLIIAFFVRAGWRTIGTTWFNTIVFFAVTISVVTGFDVSDMVVRFIINISSSINVDFILRKVGYYSNNEVLSSNYNENVFYLMLLMFYLTCALFSFFNYKLKNKNYNHIMAFFYVNIILFIFMRNTVVLSTRIGFWGFYYIIPYFIIFFSRFNIAYKTEHGNKKLILDLNNG